MANETAAGRAAAWRRPSRRRGGIAVVFALTLFFLVGCLGLALDAAQLYNRQSELQNIADGAALAAALQLNGSAAGLQAAAQQAAAAAAANHYGYGQSSVVWSNAALTFSGAPDTPAGAWLDLAAASLAPQQLWYARVDTGALDAAAGQVQTLVLASLSGAGASLASRRLAVAGRRAVNVAPFAVCAMGPATATVARGALNEIVAYGFRQGVGYDLLKLNPVDATPLSYLVNPVDPPGQAADPANFAPAVLNAYMCTGRLALPAVPASLHVSPVPAAGFAFADQLNARFDLYAGSAPCNPVSAPPDRNVRQYLPGMAGWWSAAPAGQTAAVAVARPPLRTVADLPSPSGETVSGPSYGVLWSYTQALPAAGSVALVDWASLYPANSGAAPQAGGANAYPVLPLAPYSRASGAFFLAPSASRVGLAQRRVLNVPLLSCPVGAGATATVLAVGRFFMSAQASAQSISGEFAGLAAPAALVGPVGLFQ